MSYYRLWVAVCALAGLRACGVALVTWADLDSYRALEAAGPAAVRMGWQALLGLALLGIAGGLLRRRAWAFWAAWPGVGLYALLSYLWFATYAQGAFAQGRVPFCGAGLMAGWLSLAWPWLRLKNNYLGQKNNNSGETYE